MSLTDHWELAVEIPINPLSGSVQSVTGSAVDNTDPLNPVINSTGGGGSQTLAEVLLEGNITDGTDISISNGDKILLDNGANLKKGTTDAGLGGTKGIALRCAVDYELKWEAGRLYVMGGDGFTIREVSHNFTTTPTATDDDTKGFVIDSRWILDNGDVYLCTDATTGAAVWELVNTGTIPTLQEVLTKGNEATYLDAKINRIGLYDQANADYGYISCNDNVLAFSNPTDGYFDLSYFDGIFTVRSSKLQYPDYYLGQLIFSSITQNREYTLPDADGTIALTSDITVPTLEQVTDEGNETTNAIKAYQLVTQTNGSTKSMTLSSTNVTTERNAEWQDKEYTGIADISDIPTIQAGTNISIDDTDPLNPIISSTGGGVTSVGLTMPSAFSVTNSPITSSGDIAVTGAGLVSQYVRGDGTLANFPNSTGGGSSVNYYLNGSVSQGTFGGDTFYEMSKTPILGAGTNFTRTNGAGNGYIASFITDAGDPSFLNIPGGNWNLEFYFQSSATGGSPQFYGEIYKVSATDVFTLVASGSANPEGITNGTSVDQYYTSIPVPQTSLLITDRLAIRIYVITSGKTITLHTENGNLCEVLTTFTTGLTALNGLTQQVQNLAVGTSGTDFAISSSTDTHTFNLPTASASNRGALSSTDWTTFNNKQNALSFTPYKFIQTGMASHTGTTAETVIATATIAGGTFNSSDVMKVIWQLTRSAGGTSASTFRLRINTSNTLTGSTLLATATTTTAVFSGTGSRTFSLQGGNLIGFPPTQNALTDYASNTFTPVNTAYNTANVLYVFFTLQLVSSSDNTTITLANITN
jgi:hypothetical protein